MNNCNKAIFFDRDGVLNKERKDYVKNIGDLEIFSNIVEPIKKLKNSGFMIVVVTNQSAINRGLTTQKKIDEIHLKFQEFLIPHNIKIDKFYICPHRPDENCVCRKPKPGLVIKAKNELHLDLESSWLIGDNDTDIQAAITAGCKSIKIESNSDLPIVVQQILNSLN